MNIDPDRIPAQARYWALHCGINALPSFIVATCYLGMARDPAAVVAMLLAILTFIAAYTLLTSIKGLFTRPESVLARALKTGVKARMIVSLVSLPFLLPTPAALFVPDVWAGMLAVGVVNSVGQVLGAGVATIGPTESGPPMLAVYATTLIEGLILSFMLLMISFFSLLFIQTHTAPGTPGIPPESAARRKPPVRDQTPPTLDSTSARSLLHSPPPDDFLKTRTTPPAGLRPDR